MSASTRWGMSCTTRLSIMVSSRTNAAPCFDRLGIRRGEYVLATVHRAENTDDEARLRAIFGVLQQLAAELDVILPLHPRTRGRLADAGIPTNGRLRMIDPVGYLDMGV